MKPWKVLLGAAAACAACCAVPLTGLVGGLSASALAWRVDPCLAIAAVPLAVLAAALAAARWRRRRRASAEAGCGCPPGSACRG